MMMISSRRWCLFPSFVLLLLVARLGQSEHEVSAFLALSPIHLHRPLAATTTTTTRRYDSESQHHDWDILQKKLQQKIHEQRQNEQRQLEQKQQQQQQQLLPQRYVVERDSDPSVLPSPHVDYTAQDVVTMCMNHLQDNHVPIANAGLQVCFDFSSDRCRAASGGTLSAFVEYAANPVFGMLLFSDQWKILSVGPVIAGTQTRGAMQTVLIEVDAARAATTTTTSTTTSSSGSNPSRIPLLTQQPKSSPKRFLWTLQQERRPPRQGCWLVHEVMFTKNAYALTL